VNHLKQVLFHTSFDTPKDKKDVLFATSLSNLMELDVHAVVARLEARQELEIQLQKIFFN